MTKSFPSVKELPNFVLPKYQSEFDAAVPDLPPVLKDIVFEYVESSVEDRTLEIRSLISCGFERFTPIGRNNDVVMMNYKNIQVPGEAKDLTKRLLVAIKNNHTFIWMPKHYFSMELFESYSYSQLRQYVFEKENPKQNKLLSALLNRPEPKSTIYSDPDGLVFNFILDHNFYEHFKKDTKADLAKLPLCELSDHNAGLLEKTKIAAKRLIRRFKPY